MSHFNVPRTLLGIARSTKRLNTNDPLTQCLAPRLARSYASETPLPGVELAQHFENEPISTQRTKDIDFPEVPVHAPRAPQTERSTPTTSSQILTTLYSWPTLEPVKYRWYKAEHLNMPLRRDILHRAVIFEADATRHGTASTKWRGDVHGSNRKIQQQKGTGRARVGDKKSPIRRGGGVAFGPHPRDFSTDLPRKIYDIAWRTALSYRYRKGELIILESKPSSPVTPRLLTNIFESNQWGKENGRSLLVTTNTDASFFKSMEEIGAHGIVKDITDVDVKDLLETGRIIIEQSALTRILAAHESDLKPGRGVNKTNGTFGTAAAPSLL